MTWDDTVFVNEEALAAMEDEASGQQYTPVVQDLNLICANCIVFQRDQWTDMSMEPHISNGEAHKDEDDDEDMVEDVVNEQDEPDANSKSKTK